MKHLMVLAVLVAVAAAGCGKKQEASGGGSGSGSGSAPSGPTRKMGLQTDQDCDRLGKKSAVDSMAMTPPGATAEERAKLQAISDEAGVALAALCKSDNWSGEAIACGLSAKDPSVECKGKLTDAQMEKLGKVVSEIFAKGAGVMAPPPGGAPEGAGSAAPAGGSAAPEGGSAAGTGPAAP